MKTPYSQVAPVSGFSLVEITVAIGIFAFVVVGILGLLPAALKIRNDSAQDTRAAMIADELFGGIAAGGGLTNVLLRDGPGEKLANESPVDLKTSPVVIGYTGRTTVPYYMWYPPRASGGAGNPGEVWSNGIATNASAMGNDIQTLAYLRATNVSSGLYRVSCEVRSPAVLPLTKSKSVTFTTLVADPTP